MSHPQRRHLTGDLHFITFSCQGRQSFLATPEAKSLFLNSLESRRVNTASSFSAMSSRLSTSTSF